MKSEMDITHIFIRYVTVTLQRQTNAFYNRQGKIFSYESQELTDTDHNDKSFISWIGERILNPEEILDLHFQKEQLYLSLEHLSSEELSILSEKFEKK